MAIYNIVYLNNRCESAAAKTSGFLYCKLPRDVRILTVFNFKVSSHSVGNKRSTFYVAGGTMTDAYNMLSDWSMPESRKKCGNSGYLRGSYLGKRTDQL